VRTQCRLTREVEVELHAFLASAALPRERTPVPSEYETGRVREPVLALCKRGKFLVTARNPRPHCTAQYVLSKPAELTLLLLFGKYDTGISDIRQQSHYRNVSIRK
jgi:hypothetical protein